MRANGHIRVTVHRNIRKTIDRLDYEWEGGDVVEIQRTMLTVDPRPGELFNVGPFVLRCVDPDGNFENNAITAIRERPIVSYLYYTWHRWGKWADIAYRRFIITLAIWGLASFEYGRLPSWRDVYVVQWISRKKSALL